MTDEPSRFSLILYYIILHSILHSEARVGDEFDLCSMYSRSGSCDTNPQSKAHRGTTPTILILTRGIIPDSKPL